MVTVLHVLYLYNNIYETRRQLTHSPKMQTIVQKGCTISTGLHLHWRVVDIYFSITLFLWLPALAALHSWSLVLPCQLVGIHLLQNKQLTTSLIASA